MPHLQFDLTRQYPVALKRQLAQQLGALYADIMQTTPDLVHVTFRELGEGNVWACGRDLPQPAAVISCEIRRGRPPEQRERLGRAVLRTACLALELDPTTTPVEMTQHAGDENYREGYIDGVLQGTVGRDWSPQETTQSLVDTIIAEKSAVRSG